MGYSCGGDDDDPLGRTNLGPSPSLIIGRSTTRTQRHADPRHKILLSIALLLLSDTLQVRTHPAAQSATPAPTAWALPGGSGMRFRIDPIPTPHAPPRCLPSTHNVCTIYPTTCVTWRGSSGIHRWLEQNVRSTELLHFRSVQRDATSLVAPTHSLTHSLRPYPLPSPPAG